MTLRASLCLNLCTIHAIKGTHMPTQRMRRKSTKPARPSGTRKSQSRSRTTTDPREIRSWVESRGGHPASVAGTSRKGGAGLLRIDYPGYRGQQRLREISWDKFFDKFEESGLAFVYQDKTATGRESRFSKLIRRRSASRRKSA